MGRPRILRPQLRRDSLGGGRELPLPWKPVRLPILEKLVGSGQTYQLPTTNWPSWARTSTQLRRLWIYCPPTTAPLSSTATTAAIVARLLSERYDSKDAPRPYNYNFYLLAESTSGGAFQSGPIRTSEPPHHAADPTTWLDSYGPPPV